MIHGLDPYSFGFSDLLSVYSEQIFSWNTLVQLIVKIFPYHLVNSCGLESPRVSFPPTKFLSWVLLRLLMVCTPRLLPLAGC